MNIINNYININITVLDVLNINMSTEMIMIDLKKGILEIAGYVKDI